jgi:cytidylate kinase
LSDRTTIAIDGPVASGKTVVGRLVAQRLGYEFLDTGAMYRAVTWEALQLGIALEEEALAGLARSLSIRLVSTDGAERLTANGDDITEHLREPAVEGAVSAVSAVRGVREALVEQQRSIAKCGRIVVAGRDIGTVVLPHAGLKVYLTASVDVRAQRRYKELKGLGKEADIAQVLEDLNRRDRIDSRRTVSPLQPAKDAVQIATGGLEAEEVVREVVHLAEGA